MDNKRLKQLSGGVTGGEKAKLIAMLVLLILIIGGYFHMQSSGPKIERASYQNVESEDVGELKVNRIPGGKPDPDKLALVSEDQPVVRETEPYRHLLEESRKLVAGDLDSLGIRRAPYRELLDHPSTHRGAPFTVKGVLERIKAHESEGETEYRGIVQTQDQERYFFTVVDPPAAEVVPGAIVKVSGFFFKVFAFIAEDNQVQRDLPYLVGKTIKPSVWTMPPVTLLDPDIIAEVKDSSARDMAEDIEADMSSPLWHSLSFLQNGDLENYDSASQSLTRAQIMANADALHGTPVHVVGRFGQTWVDILGPDGENPVDVSRGHHFLLYHAGEKLTYALSMTPVPDWLRADDLVTVKGIFLKKYAWETQSQGVFSGPLLLVYGFEKWEKPKAIWSRPVIFTVIGLLGFVLLGFVIAVFSDKRGKKKFRTEYLDRKKRLREASNLDLSKTTAPTIPDSEMDEP